MSVSGFLVAVLVAAGAGTLLSGGAHAQSQAVPLLPGSAQAPLGVRPSPSPLAPGDLTKPVFDTVTPQYAPSQGPSKSAGTVVAEVDGRVITLGDVGDAIRSMPSSIAAMPFEALFNTVVEQLVRREALAIRAQQLGLEADPIIRRRVKAAADQTLGNEMLRRNITAGITDRALRERYERDFEGRPGPEEARVRVIMVPTEAEALTLLAEIKAGADFATVARRSSKDTTARAGGDLGFMRQQDLNPEIAAVAFSLPIGEINARPIRRAGAWFLVKVEERRFQPTPSFFAMRKDLTEALLREAVPAAVQSVLKDVVVRKYDMNGNEETILKDAAP